MDTSSSPSRAAIGTTFRLPAVGGGTDPDDVFTLVVPAPFSLKDQRDTLLATDLIAHVAATLREFRRQPTQLVLLAAVVREGALRAAAYRFATPDDDGAAARHACALALVTSAIGELHGSTFVCNFVLDYHAAATLLDQPFDGDPQRRVVERIVAPAFTQAGRTFLGFRLPDLQLLTNPALAARTPPRRVTAPFGDVQHLLRPQDCVAETVRQRLTNGAFVDACFAWTIAQHWPGDDLVLVRDGCYLGRSTALDDTDLTDAIFAATSANIPADAVARVAENGAVGGVLLNGGPAVSDILTVCADYDLAVRFVDARFQSEET